jgi:hypothetical protein
MEENDRAGWSSSFSQRESFLLEMERLGVAMGQYQRIAGELEAVDSVRVSLQHLRRNVFLRLGPAQSLIRGDCGLVLCLWLGGVQQRVYFVVSAGGFGLFVQIGVVSVGSFGISDPLRLHQVPYLARRREIGIVWKTQQEDNKHG